MEASGKTRLADMPGSGVDCKGYYLSVGSMPYLIGCSDNTLAIWKKSSFGWARVYNPQASQSSGIDFQIPSLADGSRMNEKAEIIGSFADQDGRTGRLVRNGRIVDTSKISKDYALFSFKTINGNGMIACLGRKPDEDSSMTRPLLLLKVKLAVDADRSGTEFDPGIEFGGNDQTSENEPYLFWINNDVDYGNDDEAEDREPTVATDYLDGQIDFSRDLEDFSRIWIDVDGIADQLKDVSLRLGLEWKNLEARGPDSFGFRFGQILVGDTLAGTHKGNPLRPVVFTLWKKGEGSAASKIHDRNGASADFGIEKSGMGKPVYFDLSTRIKTSGPSENSMEVVSQNGADPDPSGSAQALAAPCFAESYAGHMRNANLPANAKPSGLHNAHAVALHGTPGKSTAPRLRCSSAA